MFRKSIAVAASIVLSAGLATSSAYAAKPHVTVKVAVKAGGACTKVGAKATVKKVPYVCVKNTKTKKLIWVKKVVAKKVLTKKTKKLALSAECLGLQKSNIKMKSDYENALAQITDTQAKIAAIPGTAGDTLRAQVDGLKATILVLGPTVANATAQFKLFCS